MKLVLLSGGSGKRLWPLSNDSRSKQFLRVLEKDSGGEYQSMVERVWDQLKLVNLVESTVIATSKSQVEILNSQLGNEARVIVEPTRRDTFPAIALSATYLYTMTDINLDEVIAVLPVDPYVDNNFFEKIKEMEDVLLKSNADIALIGVEPTYPSEKYGYIVPDKEAKKNRSYFEVQRFTEKPKKVDAEELILNGALWNCGVFAFKLGYLISLLESKGLPIHYEELLKSYDNLPKISFDYEVVEMANNIIVLPYKGNWKDLGTWNTLTEEMGTVQIGKGMLSDSKNVHLINELDLPVTILGVSNLVVAVSPDGILVADKEKSPRIKELVSNFNERPMYEERRWGWYRVLDYTKYDSGEEVLTKRIGIKKGASLSYQYHLSRSETWTILKGDGLLALNGKIMSVGPGTILKIEKNDRHSIKAISDLEIIEVQRGNELIEEDIVRLFMSWEEIENYCWKFLKE
jgi:mannose-1-phosphate guanylyltransferase